VLGADRVVMVRGQSVVWVVALAVAGSIAVSPAHIAHASQQSAVPAIRYRSAVNVFSQESDVVAAATSGEHSEEWGILLFGLMIPVVLFWIAVVLGLKYGIRWLAGPTTLDSQYASRPPQLTHRCSPPRGRREGSRWVCPACGCPWMASRGGTGPVPVTVEVGPGPPGTKRLETQYRQASGGLYWFFDRATYEA
jgi:hypothetical protein